MLWVTLSTGETVGARFEHLRMFEDREKFYGSAREASKRRAVTLCVLFWQDAAGVVSHGHCVGVAECGLRDQFNKAIGRRVALGRAMKALGWPAAQREEMLRAYA